MRNFFKAHPYVRIYLIVLIYAGLLFGWGKLTKDTEWYLDNMSLWVSVGASVIGVALSVVLLYFRYSPDNRAAENETAV